jgi:hypothetical protein
VFVSVPDGFRAVGPFWRPVPAGSSGALEFPLAGIERPAAWSFVHASDTHVQSSSLPRIERLRALTDSLAPAFVLLSGDLVRDALRVPEAEARGYYELFRTAASRFGRAVWTVPGNHELFGIERHHSLVSPSHPLYGRGMYRDFLGPDYYSFTYGGIHFIALNTVAHDDLWYHGQVDSVQMEWLRADLGELPPDMPVVTFNHIPFLTASETLHGYTAGGPAPTVIEIEGRRQFRHSVANARDVLALLWRHPYPLALGGHIHLRESLRLELEGQRTRFDQAAAVVGGWRDGPFASVSGITVYRVVNGRIGEGEFVPLDPPPTGR